MEIITAIILSSIMVLMTITEIRLLNVQRKIWNEAETCVDKDY